MTKERPTAKLVSLTSLRKSRPFPGQRVLALTEGNKLVEVLWSESNASHFFAWMPYPKVPEDVKEELSEHYFRNVNKEEMLA
jgi:hypothetical protein